MRSADISASTSAGEDTLGSVRGVRISGTVRARRPERDHLVASPLGTGFRPHGHVVPGDQIGEEPRHARQATPDRPG